MLTQEQADKRVDKTMMAFLNREEAFNGTKTKQEKIEKAFGPISEDMISRLAQWVGMQSSIALKAMRAVREPDGKTEEAQLAKLILLDVLSIGVLLGQTMTLENGSNGGGETNSDSD